MNDNKQDVSLFNFHKQQIRVVEIDGDPWFVARDVRKVLGIQQGGTNLASLDASEKQVIRKSGSTTFKGHGLLLISESGLYKLVMRSDKPQAKTFQDWVTREVLPSIRKNGGYIKDQEKVATGEMAPQELAPRGYEALLKIVEDMKARAVPKVSPRNTRDLFSENCVSAYVYIAQAQNPPYRGGAHISAPIRDPRHTLAAYLWSRGVCCCGGGHWRALGFPGGGNAGKPLMLMSTAYRNRKCHCHLGASQAKRQKPRQIALR